MRKPKAPAACPCVLGAALFPPAAARISKAQEIDNYIKPFADANQFSGVAPAVEITFKPAAAGARPSLRFAADGGKPSVFDPVERAWARRRWDAL